MDVSVNSLVSVAPAAKADVKADVKSVAVVTQPAAANRAPKEPVAKVAPVREPTPQEVRRAVAEVRKAVEIQAPNQISFSVDDESGRSVVRIIDQKTGATIRQIPSQEMLDIAKSIDKMQGLLFKETA